jgi:putative ABC transport system permease protein
MFLALAELKRAKTRFALLSFAVGLLVYLILFQQSLTNGLVTQFVGSIRNQSAPVLVLGADARKNLAASRISTEQIEAVKAVPGIAQTGRMGQGTFTVGSSKFANEPNPTKQFVDATIFGYDLGGLGQPTTLAEGRLPNADNEAVGSTLNKDTGFGVGDIVTVQPGGEPITIVGLADEINYSVTPTFFTSWNTYAAARKVLNPDATEVSVTALLVSPANGSRMMPSSNRSPLRYQQSIPSLDYRLNNSPPASVP